MNNYAFPKHIGVVGLMMTIQLLLVLSSIIANPVYAQHNSSVPNEASNIVLGRSALYLRS
jgi:hypothetical protein